MNKKVKNKLYRIIVSAILFACAVILKDIKLVSYTLFVIAYIVSGYDVLLKAFKNIKRGKIFDENFLMTIATIGAFGIGEMPEAVAVMLFYQVGEMFQDYAVNKSRKSITELMNIKPDYANVVRNGKSIKVSPNEVKIGEAIIIKTGEKVPLDGTILDGETSLNMLALTGETMPKYVKVGDEVLSGGINNEGTLKVQVTKKFGESTVSKILNLVENASSKKSKSESYITKFAKYYTPTVVVIAVVMATVFPILLKQNFNIWLYRALSFLVVSCPCAIVVSIPLSFFGGLGASSKVGVLVKGSNYLEALSKSEILVCDKTGTLTEGSFKVQEIETLNISEKELLEYAAYAECFSTHPIALSLKETYVKDIEENEISEVKEISGKGVFAKVRGKEIIVGNESLLKDNDILFVPNNEPYTSVYVAVDKKYVGYIVIADKIKEDTYTAIKLFREKSGIKKVVMLTGDKENIAKTVSDKLKLDKYYAELLPEDKVNVVQKLMNEKSEKGKLIFVGDGINDAPVLAGSDIGVAMGGLGSDVAIEAADLVIMTDELSKIATSINISKKTMKIVKENIVMALLVKISVLVLSAIGIATMWSAVFADVGVTVIAVLNSLRTLRSKK